MSWNIAKPGDQINGPVAVTGNLNVDSNTLFVDSANNRVGVLTASPTVPLDVVGDAKISGNLTVDTNTLVVDAANNRLGIGTATPEQLLHIYGAAPRAIIENSANNGIYLRLKRPNKEYIVALDINNNGGNDFTIFDNTAAALRFSIASDGVCTWSNVGGVAGTAMTLNASGLGVGVVPSGSTDKLSSVSTVGVIVSGSTADMNFRNSSLTAIQRIRYNDSTGGLTIGSATSTAYPVELGGNTTARAVTIDSSFNVGIGTTTPSAKLQVMGLLAVQDAAISFPTSGVGLEIYYSSTNSSSYIQSYNRTGSAFVKTTYNALSHQWDLSGGGGMVLTSGGNLGLGVTPSAWNGYYRAFQIGDNGTALSTFQSSFTGNKTAHLTTNAYATYSGSGVVWNYITNNWASGRLTIHNNIFEFHQAAASTGVIGYTQAMTLDAYGRLMVNTVTPYAFITAKQSANYDALTLDSDSATTYATQNFRINGVQKAQIFCDFADGSMVYRTTTSGSSLSFGTNNTERLRIKSTGQVNFNGLASDPAGAAAGDVYYNTTTNKLKCYNGTTWNDLF